jgi:hypothetical protein
MAKKPVDNISCENTHELVVDGAVYVDTRIRKTERKNSKEKTVLTHTKSITKDDNTRSYTIKMNITNGKASKKKKETDMSAEELEEFEMEWNVFWKPELLKYDGSDEN